MFNLHGRATALFFERNIMRAKVNESIDEEALPDYMSPNIIAEVIGCTSRTINRWLRDLPELGITVQAAPNKFFRALSREDVVWLHQHIQRMHEPKGKVSNE
tara:strand:- start:742 stop:1047 length:306 start_codon:yes stop_codon:yes gene_type:complete